MICHHGFHVSFHTSHVLYDHIRKWGRGKKGERGGWCTHGIDCCATSSVTSSFEFLFAGFLQVYVVWTCWSTTMVCYFKRVLAHMGGPIKAEKKRKRGWENWHLNRKFGKAFLQCQFWSEKNHPDDVGWFCEDDALRCVGQHLELSICESIHTFLEENLKKEA